MQEHPAIESNVEGTITYDSAQQIPTALHATLSLTMHGGAANADSGTGTRVDIELQR
jgi:hypothetical protein